MDRWLRKLLGSRLAEMTGAEQSICEKALKRVDDDLVLALRELILDGTVKYSDLSRKKIPSFIMKQAKQWQKMVKNGFDRAAEKKARQEREAELKRAKATGIQAPPFGKLRWNDYFWEGKAILPAFAPFQQYSSVKKPGKGTLGLSVKTKGDEPVPLTPEQLTALAQLKSRAKALGEAALKAIYKKYPQWRETYDPDSDDTIEMPVLKSAEGLRKLIRIHTVHLWTTAKGGESYVGLEISCSWDGEHGLGVLTHKGKVTDIGGADTAFNDPAR